MRKKQGSEVSMMSSGKEIKKWALAAISIMLVLGLATIGFGFTAGNYRGFYLSLTLGGIITVASVVYLPIVARKDESDPAGVATPAIQSLWISTSMGLGYVVTAFAPYFKLPQTVAAALFLIGWVMLIFGMYSLLKLSKESGTPLAV
ncbi:MAG: hypothetical protein J7L55_04955 [Desulfurococcales archaeon]|nr:hypothetical protein [Desulfurococcales archaeon]